NAAFGINVMSGTATWPGIGNQVVNCIVGSEFVGTTPNGSIGGTGTTARFGIQFNQQATGVIRGNIVRDIIGGGINRGIYYTNGHGECEVSNNRVYGIQGTNTS